MKLRISPLVVAIGVLFATLSPAMALVHPTRVAAHRRHHAHAHASPASARSSKTTSSRPRPAHGHTRVTKRHAGHGSKHEPQGTPLRRGRAGANRRKAGSRF